MVLTRLSPIWFYGYDVGLEVAFAIISLVVSIFAFRIYKKTSSRPVKLFGISFLLISISYFIESLLNLMIFFSLHRDVSTMMIISTIAAFEELGLFIHVIFMTIGLCILTYTTIKDKRLRFLWLILALTLLGIFASANTMYVFFLFASILLLFISWHFIVNFMKNRQTTSLLVAIAFIFLLFGKIHYLFSVNHQLFFAIGHILEFFAYVLILVNLYLVLKK